VKWVKNPLQKALTPCYRRPKEEGGKKQEAGDGGTEEIRKDFKHFQRNG